MSSGEQDDASTSESGEDEELHSLLGAFASYHRVQKQSDTVPEGVNVRFGVGGRDERVFASRTSLEFEVNRWDADELGSAPVVHTWDLTPAAADRLNRELLPAALREAATRKGLVVSNRGGYHSTPDFLSRIGDGAESRGADEAEQNERNLSVPVPAARFLSELIRAVALETGKPGVPSVRGGGRKRTRGAPAPAGRNEKASPPHATVTSSWVNVSRSGDTHGLHHHAGASWSGVYYVAAPEAVAVDFPVASGSEPSTKKSGGPPRAPRVLRRRRTVGPRDAEERVVRVDVRDTQARPARAFSVAHAARRAVVRGNAEAGRTAARLDRLQHRRDERATINNTDYVR